VLVFVHPGQLVKAPAEGSLDLHLVGAVLGGSQLVEKHNNILRDQFEEGDTSLVLIQRLEDLLVVGQLSQELERLKKDAFLSTLQGLEDNVEDLVADHGVEDVFEVLVEEALLAQTGGQPQAILDHAVVAARVPADVKYPLEEVVVGGQFLRGLKNQVDDYFEQADPAVLVFDFEDLFDDGLVVVANEVCDGSLLELKVADDEQQVLEDEVVLILQAQVLYDAADKAAVFHQEVYVQSEFDGTGHHEVDAVADLAVSGHFEPFFDLELAFVAFEIQVVQVVLHELRDLDIAVVDRIGELAFLSWRG